MEIFLSVFIKYLIIIIAIILFFACRIEAPHDKYMVIKRKGVVISTLKPGETSYINPFIDRVETLKPSSAHAFNAKPSSTSSFKLNIPVYSLDKKSFTVYISGSYSFISQKSISTANIENIISKSIRTFYSTTNYPLNPIELNKNELNLLDLLRDNLSKIGLKMNSFNLSLEESDNFEKVDCVHYDTPKIPKKHSTNFDFYETNKGAITHFSNEELDDPIKESFSLRSALLNTLDNTDSDIDPIDNKF